MEKIEKIFLPISLILVALILWWSFYFVQIEKQHSIERQYKLKMELEKEKLEKDKEKIKILKENDDRKYISKRKKECLEIYKIESEKWNNVNWYKYNIEKDECFIEYFENKNWIRETFWKWFWENKSSIEENKKLKDIVKILEKNKEEIEEAKKNPEYIKRNTFNGKFIDNVHPNSYYSWNNFSFNNYKQEKNENWVILINDKGEKIYLWKDCDAFSKKFWIWNWESWNWWFIIYFKNNTFWFPRQELIIDNKWKCSI